MFATILLQAPAGNMSWLFIIGFIAIFYFFMILPQQKQQKKLRDERNNMKKDDSVVTSGGLYGKIDGVVSHVNKKGVEEVDGFILRLKPDYTLRVQVNRDSVFKDAGDAQAAAK